MAIASARAVLLENCGRDASVMSRGWWRRAAALAVDASSSSDAIGMIIVGGVDVVQRRGKKLTRTDSWKQIVVGGSGFKEWKATSQIERPTYLESGLI